MTDIDCIVIGGGVTGLSCAYYLSNIMNVYVLEKEKHYGLGISSRNSEVIHAGIYYPPDSLKSKFCIEGKNLLYDFLEKENLPYKKIGKYIVAIDSEGEYELEKLKENALSCGLNDLDIINGQQLIEKGFNCKTALFSPSTGILSVHDFMDKLVYYIKNNGSDLVFNSEVVNIEKSNNEFIVYIKENNNEIFEIKTKYLINASGLNSGKISGYIDKPYEIHLCKGDYFSCLTPKPNNLNFLVYPIPEKNGTGLGIHLTLDLTGRIKFGPDIEYIEKEDYSVNSKKSEIFYNSVKKFLPWVKKEDLYPDMSGIRPKLQEENGEFKDFVIDIKNNFINLVGIESPGMTASMGIAKFIYDNIK